MPEREKKKSWWSSVSSLTSLLLVAIIPIIMGVLANLSVVGLKEGKPLYYAVVISFVVLLVMMTILVSRFKKGPTKVAALKDSLINAFCGAIESSSLNPETTKGGING